MQTLSVTLGERSYPIHIGAAVLGATALYAPHVAGRHVAVVSNPKVAPLYLDRVEKAATAAGASRVLAVLVDDGEQAKSWASLDRIFDALLAARFGRDGVMLALGGGVVGDLAGFAAATYQRGIPFLQLPTTLLAQVDSSVGGKTAINHARGKNMVGAFHQPLAVLADMDTLDSLPDRELRAGLAEVIKHGFILDARFVEWLEANMPRLLARDREALAHAVRRSCELKAQVVAADEREGGLRAILNFGHTFGHAIETGLGYGEWLHGEAVGCGMVMASDLSHRLGLVPAAFVQRVRRLVERAGLPVAAPALGADRWLQLMRVDKKAEGGEIRFVVIDRVGHASVRTAPDAMVRETIAACTA